jgi:glycosyltransferase involved in cell wall biosynthesis
VRVLLVTHRYPPLGVAGVERLAEQTARGLTALGHDVLVLTRHDSNAPPLPILERTEQDGVRVFTLTGAGPLLNRFPALTPRLERLFEIALLEAAADVVLITHLVNHSPGYVSVAHRWQVPVIMELHDFFAVCERAHLDRVSGELCDGPDGGRACATYCFPEQDRSLARWSLRTHMFRQALEHAEALIAPSNFVADYFRRTLGSSAPPLHRLGNGVDFPSAPAAVAPDVAPDVPLHLACVGVVAAHKGIHVLIEALRMARLPGVRLTLMGDINPGYFRSIASRAAEVPGLEFRALGRFAPHELPFLLTDVDAVVIPSLVWETYSIVARESFACGIPVLASRLGALTEAVRHGENGLLFEPDSALDLATTLQLLDRPQLSRLRGGIRNADWISVEERTRRLEALLSDVARRGRPLAGTSELSELAILREPLLD